MNLKSSRSRNRTASDVSEPCRPFQGVLEAVPEQGPVGQAAQSIVEGLVLQLLLQALAFGHITQREDDAFDRGVARGGCWPRPPHGATTRPRGGCATRL